MKRMMAVVMMLMMLAPVAMPGASAAQFELDCPRRIAILGVLPLVVVTYGTGHVAATHLAAAVGISHEVAVGLLALLDGFLGAVALEEFGAGLSPGQVVKQAGAEVLRLRECPQYARQLAEALADLEHQRSPTFPLGSFCPTAFAHQQFTSCLSRCRYNVSAEETARYWLPRFGLAECKSGLVAFLMQALIQDQGTRYCNALWCRDHPTVLEWTPDKVFAAPPGRYYAPTPSIEGNEAEDDFDPSRHCLLLEPAPGYQRRLWDVLWDPGSHAWACNPDNVQLVLEYLALPADLQQAIGRADPQLLVALGSIKVDRPGGAPPRPGWAPWPWNMPYPPYLLDPQAQFDPALLNQLQPLMIEAMPAIDNL